MSQTDNRHTALLQYHLMPCQASGGKTGPSRVFVGVDFLSKAALRLTSDHWHWLTDIIFGLSRCRRAAPRFISLIPNHAYWHVLDLSDIFMSMTKHFLLVRYYVLNLTRSDPIKCSCQLSQVQLFFLAETADMHINKTNLYVHTIILLLFPFLQSLIWKEWVYQQSSYLCTDLSMFYCL